MLPRRKLRLNLFALLYLFSGMDSHSKSAEDTKTKAPHFSAELFERLYFTDRLNSRLRKSSAVPLFLVECMSIFSIPSFLVLLPVLQSRGRQASPFQRPLPQALRYFSQERPFQDRGYPQNRHGHFRPLRSPSSQG